MAGPTHYVYDTPNTNQLFQGDILQRTENLTVLLKEFHAYYADNPDYEYFMILTQSCDLVRRDRSNPPKARYITIAAVSPVEIILKKEAQIHQEWWQEPLQIIGVNAFDAFTLSIASLINNNQSNYFYLHEDVSIGFQGNHCAQLLLSIPLKIEHYDLCLDAKRVQLHDTFQAKLGWLVGNAYSRVGTKDWDEQMGTNANKHASTLLKKTFRLISDRKITQAKKKLSQKKQLTKYSPEEILEQVENEKIIKPTKLLSDKLSNIITNFGLPTKVNSLLTNEIRNSNTILSEIKKVFSDIKIKNKDQLIDKVHVIFCDAISKFCNDEHNNSWNKLQKRLHQEIVQDETIKSILKIN